MSKYLFRCWLYLLLLFSMAAQAANSPKGASRPVIWNVSIEPGERQSSITMWRNGSSTKSWLVPYKATRFSLSEDASIVAILGEGEYSSRISLYRTNGQWLGGLAGRQKATPVIVFAANNRKVAMAIGKELAVWTNSSKLLLRPGQKLSGDVTSMKFLSDTTLEISLHAVTERIDLRTLQTRTTDERR